MQTKTKKTDRTEFAQEAEMLRLILLPGSAPLGDPRWGWRQPKAEAGEMADFGNTLEVHFRGDIWLGQPVTDRGFYDVDLPGLLALSAETREEIRQAARDEDIYNEDRDTVEVDAELSVRVQYPFDKLSLGQQAQYRMYCAVVNSQGVLNGRGHEWALEVAGDLASAVWEEPEAVRSDWEPLGDIESDVVQKLLDLKPELDLEPACGAFDQDHSFTEDEDWRFTTPALAPYGPAVLRWVRDRHLLETIWPGIEQPDVLCFQDREQLECAVAWAICSLMETQPEGWQTLLWLYDLVLWKGKPFEQSRDDLADRIATVPALMEVANAIRQAPDQEAVNQALDTLVEEVAPLALVWVVM